MSAHEQLQIGQEAKSTAFLNNADYSELASIGAEAGDHFGKAMCVLVAAALGGFWYDC